jgi:tetratricopeptide (TPR) repeat protein
MDHILLVRDLNAARRSLRTSLRECPDTGTGAVPHSFHTENLIEYGDRTLRRRDIAHTPLFASIATGLARVQSTLGQFDDAATTLAAWGRRDDEVESSARRNLLEAELVLIPHRRFDEALDLLHEIVRTVGLPRHVRAQAWLLSARCERRLGDRRQAATSFHEVLSSAIPSLAPLAEIGLAEVMSLDGEHAEALERSRRAVTEIDYHSNPHAWRFVLGNRAGILLRAARDDDDQAPYLKEAHPLLDEVLEESLRVLDRPHAGLSHATRGGLHALNHEWASARDAFVQSLRYYLPGEHARRSGAYRGLATTLRKQRKADMAVACYERAFEDAAVAESHDLKLKSLTGLLETVARQEPRSPEAVRAAVHLARTAAESTPTGGSAEPIAQSTALRLARVLSDLSLSGAIADLPTGGRVPTKLRLSSPEARRALDDLLESVAPESWENLLRRRIGEGIPIKAAPEPERLVPFILSYSGDTMRINQYLSEFDLKLSQAKTHLKHLCSTGVLEIRGVRKAAKYFVSFHRADTAVSARK